MLTDTVFCVRCRRMKQRREAPTEHKAREVILQVIDAQCNKHSPLVMDKNSQTKRPLARHLNYIGVRDVMRDVDRPQNSIGRWKF